MRALWPSLLLLVLACNSPAYAKLDPVKWRASDTLVTVAPGKTVLVKLRASIEAGYHLYSFTTPPGGPIRSAITLLDQGAVAEYSMFQPASARRKDPTFNIPVELFSGENDLLIPVTVRATAASGQSKIVLRVRYQACSDVICFPPTTREVSLDLHIVPGVASPAFSPPPGYRRAVGPRPATALRPGSE